MPNPNRNQVVIELTDAEYALWMKVFETRKAQVEARIGAPRLTRRQLFIEMLVEHNAKLS